MYSLLNRIIWDYNTVIMRHVSYSVLLALSLFAQAHTSSANELSNINAGDLTRVVSSVKQQDQYTGLNQSFQDGLAIAKYLQGAAGTKEPEAFKHWMSEHSVDKATALVDLRQRQGRDTAESFAASYAATKTQASTSELEGWLDKQSGSAWANAVKKQWVPHFALDVAPDMARAKDFVAVKNLVTESLPGQTRSAVLYVGGVNDTYKFWNKHIGEEKANQAHAVFGYEGPSGPGSQPHNVDYLNVTAQNISDALFDLSKQGVEDIQIVAHSLGGVVSKKALLVFEEQHGSATFKNISFTAVSSPFGGFASADMAEKMPFFKSIAKMFNVAMAPDMGPSSQFYQSISQPLNPHIKTNFIESPSDPVVSSSNPLVMARYAEVTQSFQNKIVVDGGGSHVYAQDPAYFKSLGISLTQTSAEMTINNDVSSMGPR